jgi:hypothetical protein
MTSVDLRCVGQIKTLQNLMSTFPVCLFKSFPGFWLTFIDIYGSKLVPGPFVRRAELSEAAQRSLFVVYKNAGIRLYRSWDPKKPRNGFFLTSTAAYIRHFDLDGRRIVAIHESKSTAFPARSSIVKVTIAGKAHVGEVLRLFYHDQEGFSECHKQLFAEMRWMICAETTPIMSNPWASL